jgi:radical SAM protein with 4Fe4S-binding SPASM domain
MARMDVSAFSKSPGIQYSEAELLQIWKAKIINIVQAWGEYSRGEMNPTSLPFKGILELTQNCNFKCYMCPQSTDPKFAKYNNDLNMPAELFVRLAEEFFPSATFVDLRGFGESTILPWWNDVLSYLERFPFVNWHLVTNLGVPRPAMWERMIQLGFELGFSCDGATKETFEAIRVNSRFPTILSNLEAIKQARQKWDQRGFIYFISTIQKRNIHELRQIVEMAHRYDVSEVQFKAVQGFPWQPELYAMKQDEVAQLVNEAVDCAAELKVNINFNDHFFTKNIDPVKLRQVNEFPRPSKSNFYAFDHEFWNAHQMTEILEKMTDSSRVSVHQKCFKPFSFTYVNYEGFMGTCNHMMFPDLKMMGDLNKNSFKEIWNSEKYVQFRRELWTAKPSDARCQWCFKHRLAD